VMDINDTIAVTGGAGFIGPNFLLRWFKNGGTSLVNLDALTYAGNAENLDSLKRDERHVFAQADICDADQVATILRTHRPKAIVHFAAASHVDRSNADLGAFIRTNVQGTHTLLEQARRYWLELDPPARASFRFLHVSTDEVVWIAEPGRSPFIGDYGVRAKQPLCGIESSLRSLCSRVSHTYGLPVLTTNCSNNYGPYQFPEKLIPPHDSECARRQAFAGLWRWAERARLAVCRRPLRGYSYRARARSRRRNLQHWREQRTEEYRRSDNNL
jgi:dTDP-glucose 4,6-dehydratase